MPSQDITNTVTACPIEPRIRELEGATDDAITVGTQEFSGLSVEAFG